MPTDFEDLRHLGDELAPDLRDSFYRMVGASERYAESTVGTPDLLRLIAEGNSGALQTYAIRLVTEGLIPNSIDFMNIMYVVMLRAGTTTIASTSLTIPVKDSLIDIITTISMERGKQKGGQWVTNISRETASVMRDTMLDAVKRGVGAEQLGRELRGLIGILPDHKIAYDNYRNLLQRRVQSGDLSEQVFERLTRRYYSRLLAWRAEMIARTETMFAVHEGQLIAWYAMVNAGILQPQRTWIEWVVTDDDRLCDRCAPMDEKRVGFIQLDNGLWSSEEFVANERGFPHGKPPYADSPYDRRMARRGPLRPRVPKSIKVKKAAPKLKPMKEIKVHHPPLHPNCRCSMRLRFG